jgi:hypothetical protein
MPLAAATIENVLFPFRQNQKRFVTDLQRGTWRQTTWLVVDNSFSLNKNFTGIFERFDPERLIKPQQNGMDRLHTGVVDSPSTGRVVAANIRCMREKHVMFQFTNFVRSEQGDRVMALINIEATGQV